ncbi:DNA-directed RNA polymerase sigma-70 factor [Bacteroidia bacterium]|nr:DNA-directed RNA polymerase sigma-70 factor [Bacteroidia bacterium]
MLNKTEFEILFNRYFDAIRSFAFYRCGDMETASDIAQDVFLRVWEKRQDLNTSKINVLLYKMAKDFCTSNYRHNLCRMNFEQAMTLQNDCEVSPEDEMQFKQMVADYALVLSKIPENQRVVFLMSREDGMKYRDIAECLHISVKAVEKRMTSALKFIKKNLLQWI